MRTNFGKKNDNVMLEVHRFVGWEIFSRTKIVQIKIILYREKKGEGNINKLLGWMYEKDLIEDMVTYEEDVIGDMEYVEEFYPLEDKIYNRGRMMLVAKASIPWAAELIKMISCYISKETILQNRCDGMKRSRINMIGNQILFQL